jgi:TetR/AcrR family transcriptional regulator, transcriptional repressor for nem operon
MAQDTREILLEVGNTLFMERGYAGTGLQDILRGAGVPKGSFYHHFGSKEEFGLQLVERFAAVGLAELERRLAEETLPHLQRLRRFFEAAVEGLGQQGCCRGGCLMGTLGHELANVSEPIRQRVTALFRRWQGRIEGCLRSAQEAGELPGESDPAQLAAYCLLAWEGALQQMKIQRDTAPLRVFLAVTFGPLLAGTPASAGLRE